MFEEAQLYSPVSHHDDGTVEVHLGQDHPGFHDAEYRARRNAIAARAVAWQPGQPLPRIDYTDGETAIWRQVSARSWPTSTAGGPIPSTSRPRSGSVCPPTGSRSWTRCRRPCTG